MGWRTRRTVGPPPASRMVALKPAEHWGWQVHTPVTRRGRGHTWWCQAQAPLHSARPSAHTRPSRRRTPPACLLLPASPRGRAGPSWHSEGRLWAACCTLAPQVAGGRTEGASGAWTGQALPGAGGGRSPDEGQGLAQEGRGLRAKQPPAHGISVGGTSVGGNSPHPGDSSPCAPGYRTSQALGPPPLTRALLAGQPGLVLPGQRETGPGLGSASVGGRCPRPGPACAPRTAGTRGRPPCAYA